MNIWKKSALAAIILVVSFGSYAYPFFKKGYPVGSDYLNLIEARNRALGGTYAMESADGAFLSSASARERGVAVGMPNPLTPIIYGALFEAIGFQPDLPMYLAPLLFAVFNVILFVLISRLWTVFAGFTAGLVSAFMPAMALGANHAGFYEWALVFFGLGLLAYFGSRAGPWGAGIGRVVAASALFALAALARNAFAISFVPLALYDFWLHRSVRRSALFAAPFVLLFGLTLTPFSWLPVPNGYTSTTNQPFQQIGHFFNDPYSYYHDHERFIREAFNTPGFLDRVGTSFAIHWGRPVTIGQRLNAYWDSFTFYVEESWKLTNIGGPLVLGVILLGAVTLWRQDKRWLQCFGVWIAMWLGYLVYARSGNWDHFVEIAFVWAVLLGMGAQALADRLAQGRWRMAVGVVLLFLLASHLAYASKWRFHEAYESSRIGDAYAIAESVRQQPLAGTYAMDVSVEAVYAFAYHAGVDVVYFHPDTIERLLRDRTLADAFTTYSIDAVVGFPPELAAKIRTQTRVPVIEYIP